MKPESPNNFFSELFRIKWSGCFYAEDNSVSVATPGVIHVQCPASWFSYLKATPGKQGEKLSQRPGGSGEAPSQLVQFSKLLQESKERN